jgi:hypothetical protein
MNDDDLARTNDIDGAPPPRRRWRPLALGLAALAAAAGLAFAGIALAGGGSESPGVANVGSTGTTSNGSSGGSGDSEREQALAYSRCMREHGINDFPDPDSDGNLQLDASPGSNLDPNNPQYQAADAACKHLLPNGGQPPTPDPELRAKTLKYARCMRNHGITDFPDPNSDGTLKIEPTPGSNLDPNNPQYQSAHSACKRFLPNSGKGGSLERSGQ